MVYIREKQLKIIVDDVAGWHGAVQILHADLLVFAALFELAENLAFPLAEAGAGSFKILLCFFMEQSAEIQFMRHKFGVLLNRMI